VQRALQEIEWRRIQKKTIFLKIMGDEENFW
jgi:hypothetical protein